MSETPAMSRTLGSTDEFERRMRMVGQPAAQDNPLAELARLVGQEDPFRNLTPQGRAAAGAVRQKNAVRPQADGLIHDDFSGRAGERDFAAFDHEFGSALQPAEDAGAPDDPAVVHGIAGASASLPHRAAAAYPSVSIGRHRPLEPSPDTWAQGQAQGESPELVADRDDQPREQAGGSSRRTLVVLAAVVVLTGGGLAASFLARPTGGIAATGMTAPTILAVTGPSKVQPITAPTDPDAPSENSTLLDKKAGDGTATAKVVNSVEQPVDLAQAVKPAATAAPDDARPASASTFPEPKKVRTVTVRPDGTIVPNAPSTAAQGGVSDGALASLAFDPRMAVPPVAPDQPAAPVAAAETPPPVAPAKTTTRVPTTPQPVATADAAPTDGQTVTASTQPKPARTPPKPKPAAQEAALATPDAAAAAAAAAPSAGGGGYAVQLGAPPSEAEAKDVSARLLKKFAGQLGAYQPAIYKAESGSKTVYRIRVGNLSLADAKGLCSKLQAGGGGCFVVRN